MPTDVIDLGALPTPDVQEDVPVESCNLFPIHPAFSTTTGGQTVIIDVYDEFRIVQPIFVPSGSVLPGFSVNFYPDPS